MKIRLEHVHKQFDKTEAVRDVCLEVEHGELMALLGPSGCGKSTLLRMIAGLIPVNSGKILFGEREVTHEVPQRRNTAMVFQNYALFPHLSVAENIAFGLQVRKVERVEIRRRLARIMAMVELEGLEARRIQELSGGQRQRVALARAVIVEPDVLLFDEPLSNLDEKLRVTMRASIRKIQKELGITALYVTHDQEEAMSIADRITVMNEGQVLQIDTPEAMYHRPMTAFVADFVGRANLFTGEPEAMELGVELLSVKTSDAGESGKVEPAAVEVLGQKVACPNGMALMMRPENIRFSEDDRGVKGVVVQKEALGFTTRYVIRVGESAVMVDTLGLLDTANPSVGETVWLTFNPEHLHTLKA